MKPSLNQSQSQIPGSAFSSLYHIQELDCLQLKENEILYFLALASECKTLIFVFIKVTREYNKLDCWITSLLVHITKKFTT